MDFDIISYKKFCRYKSRTKNQYNQFKFLLKINKEKVCTYVVYRKYKGLVFFALNKTFSPFLIKG